MKIFWFDVWQDQDSSPMTQTNQRTLMGNPLHSRARPSTLVLHVDIIGNKFWEENPEILAPRKWLSAGYLTWCNDVAILFSSVEKKRGVGSVLYNSHLQELVIVMSIMALVIQRRFAISIVYSCVCMHARSERANMIIFHPKPSINFPILNILWKCFS